MNASIILDKMPMPNQQMIIGARAKIGTEPRALT
jgi:hypothetical protein